MQVFADHSFCHAAGCRKVADVFSFVMKFEKMSFDRAVQWVLEHEGILPLDVALKAPKSYLGPVPVTWIEHWKNQLTEEKSQYLYDRLILPQTIKELGLGYRPDQTAFSIPFWVGLPNYSDAEVIQFRAAPGCKRSTKYWSEKGYNRPSVINRHLINSELVILVFGTLDAVLGCQDGLPMISTNGAEVFSNPDRIEFHQLKQSLLNTKRIIILPDSTNTEFESAYKLVNKLIFELNIEVKYFPRSWNVKDYNEFRLSGGTATQFIKEIIGMTEATWRKGRLYAISDQHLDNVHQMLQDISSGNGIEAFKMMLEMAKEAGYHSSCISHALQQMASLEGPRVLGAPLSTPEWNDMIRDYEDASGSYYDLRDVLVKWNDIVSGKLGGF